MQMTPNKAMQLVVQLSEGIAERATNKDDLMLGTELCLNALLATIAAAWKKKYLADSQQRAANPIVHM